MYIGGELPGTARAEAQAELSKLIYRFLKESAGLVLVVFLLTLLR